MLISIFQLRRRRRRDLSRSPPRDRENRFKRIIFRVDTEKSRYRPRNSRPGSRTTVDSNRVRYSRARARISRRRVSRIRVQQPSRCWQEDHLSPSFFKFINRASTSHLLPAPVARACDQVGVYEKTRCLFATFYTLYVELNVQHDPQDEIGDVSHRCFIDYIYYIEQAISPLRSQLERNYERARPDRSELYLRLCTCAVFLVHGYLISARDKPSGAAFPPFSLFLDSFLPVYAASRSRRHYVPAISVCPFAN